MFEINKYKYVDRKTRNQFVIYARDVSFADKLIERVNKLGIFNLRRAKFRFCRNVICEIPPYNIEREQEQNVRKWEENANGKNNVANGK